MARPPRYSLSGQPHHVIQRGNNRTTLFNAPEDFEFYRESLQSAAHRFRCVIHAYVLMTNHVHLLLTPSDAPALGHVMRSLGVRYVRYFNRRNRRTGTLFESRYRSSVVDSEMYLFTCYRYIEENPVRAGLATNPAAYPWSSYHMNALGFEDSLLTPHARFVALGPGPKERQSAYRALFREEIDRDALTTIRFAATTGAALARRSCAERIV